MEKAIIPLVLTLILVLGASAQDATKQAVLSQLKEFYDSAKVQDMDRYIKSQDTAYLDLLQETQKTDYRAYFQAAWNLTTTQSYEIVDPRIELKENNALIFYTLKAQVQLVETKETKNIENNMVAFLVMYPEGWKVRYTILTKLYNEKVVEETSAITAMEIAMDTEDNTTIKQELKAQNRYPDENKFDTGTIPSDYTAPKGKDTSIASTSSTLWITLALILGGIVVAFFVMRNKK